MAVVVVESPAKAKTINKYLGPGYTVLASYGHVRDLPPKDGSVDPDHDFAMKWEVAADSAKHIRAIAEALKDDQKLILATDPDREGEAISWHLLEALTGRKAVKKDTEVERVVFNAITKSAVTTAMEHPRKIDMELVDAYLARRALDYLVGFKLSPVLWRKLPGSRSAGRVQSVALRLIVDREMEIEAFRAQEYWTVKALLATPRGDTFEARLVGLDGRKLDKFDLGNADAAQSAVAAIEARDLTVAAVESKPASRNPSAPFMTSTLQQEASRKFGFGARQTMNAAQRLYEAGHITYMRTDGIDMAPEAVMAARDAIKARYGEAYVPKSPRMYKNKAKNAQEAHECIRPTDMKAHPEGVRLEPDQWKLYDLIWKRSIATQMEAARFERTTVDITSADQAVRPARHRPGRDLRRLPQGLHRGPRRRRVRPLRRRGRRPPAADRQRRAGGQAQRHPGAAFHPAAAALHRGDAGQAHGGARHRPALDLCLDRLDDPGARLRPQGQEPPLSRGQGPAGHRVPRQLFRPLRRLRLHRRSRDRPRPGHHRRGGLEGAARPVLEGLLRRPRRDRGPADHRGARQDQRGAGAAPLPEDPRGPGAAALQGLRVGPAQPQDLAQRLGLHRLLELSRMPLYAARWPATTATARSTARSSAPAPSAAPSSRRRAPTPSRSR